MQNAFRSVLVGGCLLLPASYAQAQFDADTKELFAYRLTIRTLRQVDAANEAIMAEMRKDPKYRERLQLSAEVEKLEQKEELSEAEEERLAQLRDKIDALEDADDELSEGSQTLSDMEAAMRKQPVISRALEAAGLSPREYSKFLLSLFQATLTAGMRKEGLMKEIPAEVPVENVRFAEQHAAELAALQTKWKSISEIK